MSTRFGPYSRLILSGSLGLPVIGTLAFVLFGFGNKLVHEGVVKSVKDMGDNTLLAVAVALGSLVFTYFAVATALNWLSQYLLAWQRVGPLLRDTRPTPARVRVVTTNTDEHPDSIAQFRALEGDPALPSHLRSIDTSGFLPPAWLRSPCLRQPVLIYGANRRDGPFLIENTRGELALIYAPLR